VANREQRGGREKRKPKAEKPKAAPQTASFATKPAMGGAKSNAGKKGR